MSDVSTITALDILLWCAKIRPTDGRSVATMVLTINNNGFDII